MATHFTIQTTNGEIEATSFGLYHRYWLDSAKRLRNPAFDRHSSYILSLKDTGSPDYGPAIHYFIGRMRRFLAGQPVRAAEILIVPRSRAGQVSPGMEDMVQALCARDRQLHYTRNALRRHRSVPKLADGGSRSVAVHLGSIVYEPSAQAPDPKILLDDVATSGRSIAACVALLSAQQPPVQPLHCIVLGRTAGD